MRNKKTKNLLVIFQIVLLIIGIFMVNMQKMTTWATTPQGALIENVKDVFAGPRYCFMYLLENGDLYAGGTPQGAGQLGTFSTSGILSATQQVNLSNVKGNVVKVEMGLNYSLLLDDRGFIYSTGQNVYGQLGMGDTLALNVFTRIPLPSDVVITDISAGSHTAYALSSTGDLYGWGLGGWGQLNEGGPDAVAGGANPTPKVIATDIKMVSASKADGTLATEYYTTLCVVKNDGNLYVSGANNYGQYGVGGLGGSGTDKSSLTNSPFFNGKNIKQIQSGNAKTFVLLDDGTAYASGHNYYGELGVNSSNTDGKTPGLNRTIYTVTTWAPMVIPNGYIIEKFFRCSTTQMYQLSDGQVWATGENDTGDLGFYSTQNTWNGHSAGNYHKFLMTNICTLKQVDINGDLVQLAGTSGGGGTAIQNRTDQDIYLNGPIKALSGGLNECYMVDSQGYLRVTSDSGNTNTSTIAYASDKAINPSTRVFRRVQTARRTINDPIITISGHASSTTEIIDGIITSVPTNPTTITMGPQQTDTAAVYEKYVIYKYNKATDTKGTAVITSTTSDAAHLVTNGPLVLDVGAINKSTLPNGDYIIEVYRTSTIPTGETGAGTSLESNHISKIFKVADNVRVSYDSNTGDSSQVWYADYGKGSNVPVLNNTYNNAGYEFANWNTAPDGSGTPYKAGNFINNIQSNITLYAQWTSGYPYPYYAIDEDNDLILVAKSIVLDLNEVDTLTNPVLLAKSEADAWNLSNGNSRRSNIVVNESSIIKAIGTYPVTISIEGLELQVLASVIDTASSTVNESKNIVITGKGFSIKVESVQNITDSEIIQLSDAKAWDLRTGEDLTHLLEIDRGALTNDIGSYEVRLSHNGVFHAIIVNVLDAKTKVIIRGNMDTTVVLTDDLGNQYVGILESDKDLIYKNLDYGTYTVSCINPLDVDFVEVDISGNKQLILDSENAAAIVTLYNQQTSKSGFYNIPQEKFIFNILIRKAPVITVHPEMVTIVVGSNYNIFDGVTALDSVEGDITSKIEASDNFNKDMAGDYIVTYTVANGVGDEATATRKITVVNASPPVIEVNPKIVTISKGTLYDPLTGVTAIDGIDGDITFKIIIEELEEDEESTGLDINTVGTYEVVYFVTNSKGLTSTNTRTVIVEPNAPVITMNPETISIMQGYSIDILIGVTAVDDIDEDITHNIITESNVNFNTLGNYQVTYKVTNSLGKTTTVTRTIIVTDIPTPPMLLDGNKNKEPFIDQIANNTTSIDNYLLGLVYARDYKGENISSSIIITNYGGFDPSEIGNYTISYKVTDDLGKSSTLDLTVTVWKFARIVNGIYHCLGLGTNGCVWSWGYNSSGQRGYGSLTSAAYNRAPTRIPQYYFGNLPVIDIATGYYSSFALNSAGQTYAWGYGASYQLGTGTTHYQTRPVPVNQPNGIKFTQISSYYETGAGLGNDGNIYTWGISLSGSAGSGNALSKRTPTAITSSGDFIQVSQGAYGGAAVNNRGEVYVWGTNSDGAMANGVANHQYHIPTLVRNLSNIKEVRYGTRHVLALTNNGQVYAWGSNGSGRLGLGTITTSELTPKLITSLSNVDQINAGYDFSQFRVGNNIYSCGYASYAKLFGGNLTARSTPYLSTMTNIANNVGDIAGRYTNAYILSVDGKTVYGVGWCSVAGQEFGSIVIQGISYTAVPWTFMPMP